MTIDWERAAALAAEWDRSIAAGTVPPDVAVTVEKAHAMTKAALAGRALAEAVRYWSRPDSDKTAAEARMADALAAWDALTLRDGD